MDIPNLTARAAEFPATGHPVPPGRGIDALYATGHWLLGQGRAEDAGSVFRAMALLAPREERAWLGLGACHEAIGQPALALEMYGTGQALLPFTVRCRIARARLLRDLGRDEEALEVLRSASDVADVVGDDVLIDLVHAEERNARTR